MAWFFSFRKTKINFLSLYDNGALLVEIGEQEYALVYKGEKLIQGTSSDKKVLEFYRNLKKNQKRLGEFLEEARHEGGAYGKSIVETTDAAKIKAFEEGFKQFANKTIAKPFEKMKEAMPYFNHKSVGDEVIQISDMNCGNTAEVVVDFLKTGKLRLAEPSMKQSFEEVSTKFGGGHFQPATISRMKELITEGDIVVIYGVKDLSKSPMFVDGHYFVGMKKRGELHLFDGQTGEHAVFALKDNNFSKFLQSKYNKTYTEAEGGGFRFLKVR